MAEETLDEEWRIVADFPDYAVSSLGRVRRETNGKPRSGVKSGQIIKERFNKGYPMTTLYDGMRRRSVSLHILVCETFHGPQPSPQHEVAHWDGNPINARADNVRWATHIENMADCIRQRRSIRISRGKLSESDVIEIHRRIATKERYQDIADDFGVLRCMIGHIKTGRAWAWVRKEGGNIP